MTRSWTLLVIASAVALPRPSSASLVFERAVEVVDAADVIVVASVKSADATAPGLRGTLAVERVLKGEGVGAAIDVVWRTDSHVDAGGSHRGLFFLRKRGSASAPMDVIPPVDRRYPQMLDAYVRLPVVPSPGGVVHSSPLAGVADELVAVLRSGLPAPDIAPALGFAMLVFDDLGRPDDNGETHAPRALPALAKEIDAVVAGLIEAEVVAGRAKDMPLEFLVNLCRISSPAAAASIVRIAAEVFAMPAEGDPNVGLRRCTASALRSIHTEETLPVLARLLDDVDVEMRHTGVMGIGKYANTTPHASSATSRNMPAYEIFKLDPDPYVAFWRRWYSCVPCRLDRGAPAVTIASSGTCHGLTCTMVFRAQATDPDGDNMRVQWHGCEVSAVDEWECMALAGVPGIVRVRAVVRDSYGIETAAASDVVVRVQPCPSPDAGALTVTDGERTVCVRLEVQGQP